MRLVILILLVGLIGNLAALGFVYALNHWFLKDSMQITDYYRGYFVGLVTYASILSANKINKHFWP